MAIALSARRAHSRGLRGGIVMPVILALAFAAQAEETYRRFQPPKGRKYTAANEQLVERLNIAGHLSIVGRIGEAEAIANDILKTGKQEENAEIRGYAMILLAEIRAAQGRQEDRRKLLAGAKLLFEAVANLSGQATMRMLIAEVHADAGEADEARRLLKTAIALADAADDEIAKTNALAVLSSISETEAGTPDLAVLAQIGDDTGATKLPLVEAQRLRMLARKALQQGRITEAVQLQEAALALAREAGEAEGEAHALRGLGEAYEARGMLTRAEAYLRESLAKSVQSQRPATVGNAHIALARLAGKRGDAARRKHHASEAARAYETQGQVVGVVAARLELGEAAWQAGDKAEARRQFTSASELAFTNRIAGSEAQANLRLASLMRADEPREALPRAQHALERYRAAGNLEGEAEAVWEIGRIQGALEEWAAAEASLQKARALNVRLARPVATARVDVDLAKVALMTGKPEKAGSLLLAARPPIDARGRLKDRASTAYFLARASGERGDLDGAQKACTESLELARSLRDLPLMIDNLQLLGEIQTLRGDATAALKSYDEAVEIAARSQDGRLPALQAQRDKARGMVKKP